MSRGSVHIQSSPLTPQITVCQEACLLCVHYIRIPSRLFATPVNDSNCIKNTKYKTLDVTYIIKTILSFVKLDLKNVSCSSFYPTAKYTFSCNWCLDPVYVHFTWVVEMCCFFNVGVSCMCVCVCLFMLLVTLRFRTGMQTSGREWSVVATCGFPLFWFI